MSQRPGLKLATRVPMRSSTTGALLCLGVVAVLLIAWFSRFNFHALMGDDLYTWSFFAGNPSYQDVLLEAPGGKYRPVFTALQLVLFDLFSSDYRAWFAFNIALAFLIASVLFGLVRKVTRNDNAIALVAAIVFVTSRFSYFDVLQVLGALEALSILFLLIMIWTSIIFLRGRSIWQGYALAGLYLVVTFTPREVPRAPAIHVVGCRLQASSDDGRQSGTAGGHAAPADHQRDRQSNSSTLIYSWALGVRLYPWIPTGSRGGLLHKGPCEHDLDQRRATAPEQISWGSVGNGARLLVGVVLVVVALIIVASVSEGASLQASRRSDS